MEERIFKTVYFPRERVRAGTSCRVTISCPISASGRITKEFVTFFRGISSCDFRLALGNPYIEDLEAQAESEGRSLSNICLRILLNSFNEHYSHKLSSKSPIQLSFWDNRPPYSSGESESAPGLTFRESRRQRIFGWYPYVEGFSATYTRDTILRSGKLPLSVYDPFGGCGTTPLTAAMLRIPAFYSEINPLMTFITETKTKSAFWARRNYRAFARIAEEYLHELSSGALNRIGKKVDLESYRQAFPDRDFFEEQHLIHLLAARDLAYDLTENHKHARSLLLLACAANTVNSSNMTRRADLRRRRPDEYKTRVVNVSEFISTTVRRLMQDIQHLPSGIAEVTKISDDCREISPSYINSFDLALTSPPYLNGTNYFRNTKIELWLLGFIRTERDLSPLRAKSIAGGINNVTKEKSLNYRPFPFVEGVADQLENVASDRRIPTLVRCYFSDMAEMFENVFRSLIPGGKFILDIGDSRFHGIHVPTDKFLIEIAESAGFNLKYSHPLAHRYSRDKSQLVQVELVLEKPKGSPKMEVYVPKRPSLKEQISTFARSIPYKSPPYNKRNWGHVLHSLCSYQGKLKPSIAYWLLRTFVPAGGKVLDPLGGVGTIGFEAALQGHEAVSNDKNPFAAIIAKAKLNPPTNEEASASLEWLRNEMGTIKLDALDYQSATFGLNATVADYYHPRTLEEILKARKIFLNSPKLGRGEVFVFACLLHILHGNRPYALSRISHPVTPFNPSGPKVYKNTVEKIGERVKRVLSFGLPINFRRGTGLQVDFRELTQHVSGEFDAIITSPPFLGMRFDRPNWLRLWFCGWNEVDFHIKSLGFLEREQVKSTNCYQEFFDTCAKLIIDSGILIIHIGSGSKGDLAGPLKDLARGRFELIDEITENVQAIERHGIRDKGRTATHHFLFFSR